MSIHADAGESALLNYLAGTTGLGDDAALRAIPAAWTLTRPPATTKSGMWTAGIYATLGTSAFTTNGRLSLMPWWVRSPVAYDRIAIEVTTSGSGGAVSRVGMYRLSRDGLSLSLVVDAGTIDATAAPGVKQLTVDTGVLSPGLYFVGVVGVQGVTTGPTLRTFTGSAYIGQTKYHQSASAALGAGSTTSRFYVDGITGALPSTILMSATISSSSNWIVYGLRVK